MDDLTIAQLRIEREKKAERILDLFDDAVERMTNGKSVDRDDMLYEIRKILG